MKLDAKQIPEIDPYEAVVKGINFENEYHICDKAIKEVELYERMCKREENCKES